MSRAKEASQAKRARKALPVLGAAGLSLSLASGASIASPAPSLDSMTRSAAENCELILHEEEIFEQSLATFHVFDKETARPSPGRGAAHRLWRCLLPVRVLGRAKRYRF